MYDARTRRLSRGSTQVSNWLLISIAAHICMGWSPLSFEKEKKKCICNYFPLLPHHYLRDLAPALLLPFSFGLVDQQQRFDIHAAAMIEMQKGVLLTPRSFSPSLSGHFFLHHFFIFPSVFVAHGPQFSKNFTYEPPV